MINVGSMSRFDDDASDLSPDEMIQAFYPGLRQIVAGALTSPEHGVTIGPEEVTIVSEFIETDPATSEGAMERDVQIVITANRYDWRVPLKDAIAQRIGQEVAPFMPFGTTYWIWLQLLETGFYASKSTA